MRTEETHCLLDLAKNITLITLTRMKRSKKEHSQCHLFLPTTCITIVEMTNLYSPEVIRGHKQIQEVKYFVMESSCLFCFPPSYFAHPFPIDLSISIKTSACLKR